jgi:hypothetical protein
MAMRAQAADKKWTLAPYRIHITLAVDSAKRPQPNLPQDLQQAITERVASHIGPLWTAEVRIAADGASRRQCFEAREIPWDEFPSEFKEFDKLLWLGVRAVPQGYELTAREFDVYTRRWAPAHQRTVSQRSYLAEACFDLLTGVFTPLAVIEPIADDDAQVRLAFKGSDLPRRSAADPFTRSGDLFQPLLRRSDRAGKVLESGATPVPWTFLTAASFDKGGQWLADVHTGTRRPFGVQRRGRVEQLALALRNPPGPAKVRFHARSDREQGLAGYEVFRMADDGSSKLLGVTDRQGVISVPPAEDVPVSMILLRSDGLLLAKLPVPSSSGPLLEIPVADSVARLRAQSEAQVVREQLVDVVARRSIMIARIKSLLEKGRLDDAKQLMFELDSLPTSSVFGRSIELAAKKIPPSKDPTVQRSVDKMFSTTRELLGKFLDRRPIIDLQSQVNAAPTKAAADADGKSAQEL